MPTNYCVHAVDLHFLFVVTQTKNLTPLYGPFTRSVKFTVQLTGKLEIR